MDEMYSEKAFQDSLSEYVVDSHQRRLRVGYPARYDKGDV